MHHIYHTEALILEVRQSKETDMVYFVLTKELGCIYVVAHGIRKAQSKLRYGLQIGSFVYMDVVRGKDMWQITSTIPDSSVDMLLRTKEGRRLWSRLVFVLKRMAPKDEQDYFLWEVVLNFCQLAKDLIDSDMLYKLEIYFVHTLLSYLGYTTRQDAFSIDPEDIHTHIMESFPMALYIKDINRAFKESHL